MKSKNLNSTIFLSKYGSILGFILLCIIFSTLRPDAFLSTANIRNIFEQSTALSITAFGVTIVMASGNFDLSVGSIASVIGVLIAVLLKADVPIVLAIIISLLTGALFGSINGFISVYGGVSSFITTLATMTTFAGLALFLTKGSTLFSLPHSFKWIGEATVFGINVSILFMFFIAFIMYLVLEQTPYGRQVYSIGSNRQAAFFSAINIKKVSLITFILSGVTAAFAGIMLTSRLFSAHPQAGSPLMLNSAAAVFLGMTVVRSGEAHIFGTFFGVLIITIMGNGLNILAINTYVQQMLTGAIIVLAVLLQSIASKNQG